MFPSTVASSSCHLLCPPLNRARGDSSRYGKTTRLGIGLKPFNDVGISQHGTKMALRGADNSSRGLSDRMNGAQLHGIQFSAMAATLAASMAILMWSSPVQAGVLSGSQGLESIPRPQLPEFDFLKRIQEENQKKYDAYDSKFKSSPFLQELLKRSKVNSERNKQEIQNKYCERGAEWGVGDCSTTGMSIEEREAFMEMLRKKRATN